MNARVAVGVLVLYAVASIWPLALIARGPRPFVLGLPLPMFWAVLWIVIGALALFALDRVHADERDD